MTASGHAWRRAASALAAEASREPRARRRRYEVMEPKPVWTVFPADHLIASERRACDAWSAGGTWLFSDPQSHLSRLIDLRALG